MRKRIIAATPMICIILFLCLGFILDLWHPGWVVFLGIPIITCILDDKAINYIYPIICCGIYVVIGLVLNCWHPAWILFLTIPVYYTLFPTKKKRVRLE